ncbi:XF1762 family protein [Ectopseudomonas oleovorans]|uniref:XF1762 family protein n=1 Tax=Ectopseudomonas oleovorans TaxID=301 RepID=UPI0035AFBF22
MLQITPITIKEANAFVAGFHRHHRPVQGAKFALAVAVGNDVVGVAIVGRPVARGNDDGWTLEVLRVCTGGARNACSMLYGASWRAARAMGYRRLITYTLPSESGVSLRGAGWQLLGLAGGGNWNVKSRPRVDTPQILQGQKLLWQVNKP